MSLRPALTLALATLLWLGGCATRAPDLPSLPPDAPQPTGTVGVDEIQRGLASWYGETFHGRRTASGEVFDMNDFTAAHNSLPFGTQVRVRHATTGQEVVVRINDRGPHVRGRIIDLSRAAAASIGVVQAGVAPVVLLRD
ncbi:MAG: septal ring lytic transglycosylase RlpA family protein [Hydrogenophaga sp.]|nr:septal ring lytic transglycosylase RlpA family protein [Hydrogenophaga sp.]